MNEPCSDACCFFCAMNEPNPSLRRSKLVRCFNRMPQSQHNQEHVILSLSTLWHIAMKQPNDPEFPSLGIFRCMARLIQRATDDREWLLCGQNIYVPYYAAHVIGSYTMDRPKHAEKAVGSLVVAPLMELLRGKVTWVEKRVAVRALGHIAGHKESFSAVSAYEQEIVKLAMEIACKCMKEVYDQFVGVEESERVKYHCDLLTRGLGGFEVENMKAEEWARQLRRWSLYVLDCFARRERCLALICEGEFLKALCGMWDGFEDGNLFSGIDLIRTLCGTKSGRQSLANLNEVIELMCGISRSPSNYLQMIGIDCLLLLLKDQETRPKVIDVAVLCLRDLVELGSREGKLKVGETITRVVLQDYHKLKYMNSRLKSEKTERALQEIWDLKVDRKKREGLMREEEIVKRALSVRYLKKQGNLCFRSGNVEKAVVKYSEALRLCLSRKRKDRLVLYSNRAECNLLLRNPDLAISDATRALCLSSSVRPHDKSLWRRARAYDMKGLARENLMDCLAFLKRRLESNKKTKRGGIPYNAVRMINKQMNATSVFLFAGSQPRDEGKSSVVESLAGKRRRRRKIQMPGRCEKEHEHHHKISSPTHVEKIKNQDSSLNVVNHRIGSGSEID